MRAHSTLCILLALTGCSVGTKDIYEHDGYPDADSDTSTPSVPGTTVTVGNAEEDTDGCIQLGSEEDTHYWQNDIVYDFTDGACSWAADLDAQHDVQLDQVIAYGYGSESAAPTAGPSDSSFWTRTGSDNDRYLIPAIPAFVPDDLTTECFDVTAGGPENADFRWGSRDRTHIFDGSEECLEICNDGARCADQDVTNNHNHGSCAGTYTMTDPYPVTSCVSMGPVGIDFQGVIVGNDEPSSAAADGASGSGDFMLLPTSVGDSDGNGSVHVRLLPIMLSGSGKLTANAVINAITGVTIPSGGSLRLLKDATHAFRWTHGDLLVNASSISTSITGDVTFTTPKPKAPGIFVANGVPTSSLDDFRVSLSWTTGTNTGPTLAQGWALKLEDIGCSTYKQSFTLRRLTSPERLVVEPYGFPAEGETFPATYASGTASFNFSYANFHMVGQLQSMSSQGATLVLSTITYLGSNVCSTGTYSMAPE